MKAIAELFLLKTLRSLLHFCVFSIFTTKLFSIAVNFLEPLYDILKSYKDKIKTYVIDRSSDQKQSFQPIKEVLDRKTVWSFPIPHADTRL